MSTTLARFVVSVRIVYEERGRLWVAWIDLNGSIRLIGEGINKEAARRQLQQKFAAYIRSICW